MNATHGGAAYGLQWGRGFVAAERLVTTVFMSDYITLQWGRGFVAAERIAASEPYALREDRFNGAAAL